MFNKTTVADIIKIDILHAEREAHDHEKAAEHHDALATMYRGRVERLKADLGGPPVLPNYITAPCAGRQPAPTGDLSVSLEAFGKALGAARSAFSRRPHL